jgi:integrase
MAKALTAQSVERLKSDPTKRLEVPDGLLPGLYLVIQPSGARSWAVRYRYAGVPRKLTLGPHPVLDLATARERGREALQSVAAGRDPAEEKRRAAKRAREKGVGSDLVTAQLDLFIDRYVRARGRPRYADDVVRVLNREVRPVWGMRRVQEITRRDVVELLDTIVDRGAPVTANKVLAFVRKFYNWLIERSVVEVSPCARVKAPADEPSRDRVLTDDELRWLWRGSEKVGYPYGPFVKLLILTGQRRDEVAKARLSELKGEDLWTIPKERTKNSLATDVPLSAAAQEVLAAMPRMASKSGFLFTTNGETAISGYSVGKQRVDRFMLEAARQEAVELGQDPDAIVIPEWRFHDLRRTLASGLARLGHPPHIVEAILNHTGGTISGVARVYNRYNYAEEKRRSLETWGRYVMDLVDGPRAGNLIPFRA